MCVKLNRFDVFIKIHASFAERTTTMVSKIDRIALEIVAYSLASLISRRTTYPIHQCSTNSSLVNSLAQDRSDSEAIAFAKETEKTRRVLGFVIAVTKTFKLGFNGIWEPIDSNVGKSDMVIEGVQCSMDFR